MESKYINTFTDFGFKRIFGTEVNKDLLIDFLNQLFLKEEKTITDLTYLKSEQLGEGFIDRSAIFDLYCELEDGEKIIVEMQMAKQDYFKDRSIFYSTFPIRDQAKKGKWNFKLAKVYTIGILGFIFDEHKDDKDYFHHEVKLMDIKKKEVFYDKLSYIYLELPKFTKKEEDLETKFEKWLYVLRNLHKFENRPQKLQERIFKKLFEVAKIAAFSKKEQDAYQDSLKTFRDLHNVVDCARNEGEAKGRAEGLVEGLAEGKVKGKAEGLAEGLAEGEKNKAYGIAKKCLAKKMDIDDIIDLTGLSKKEILSTQVD
ncbi:MAG: hypothetical protein COB02_09495 [Candidatus Cloacimonadota bacterium]|nr:MAG: hypothetical protein COB02_09495 [Candidatus Cloacimonadota bacterium]